MHKSGDTLKVKGLYLNSNGSRLYGTVIIPKNRRSQSYSIIYFADSLINTPVSVNGSFRIREELSISSSGVYYLLNKRTLDASGRTRFTNTGRAKAYVKNGSNVMALDSLTFINQYEFETSFRVSKTIPIGEYDIYLILDSNLTDTIYEPLDFRVVGTPTFISSNSGYPMDTISLYFIKTTGFITNTATLNKVEFTKGQDSFRMENIVRIDSFSGTGTVVIPSVSSYGAFNMIWSDSSNGTAFSHFNQFYVRRPFICDPSVLFRGNSTNVKLTTFQKNKYFRKLGQRAKFFIKKDTVEIPLRNAVVLNNDTVIGSFVIPPQTNVGVYDFGVIFDSLIFDTLFVTDAVNIDFNSIEISPDCGIQGDTITLLMSGSYNYLQSSGTMNKAWINNGNTNIRINNLNISNFPVTGQLVLGSNAAFGFWDVFYTNDTTGADTAFLSQGFEVKQPVGLNQKKQATDNISVFPNPGSDIVQFRFLNSSNSNVKVFGLDGATIDEFSINGKDKFQYNVRHLKNGIYYMKFNNGKESVLKKLIIAH